MTRLLALLVLAVLFAVPVGATTLNFQNRGDTDSVTVFPATFGYSQWIESTTGGNNNVLITSNKSTYWNGYGTFLILHNPYQMTYAAGDITCASGQCHESMILLDSDYSVLWNFNCAAAGCDSGRYETKIVGSTAYLTVNGVTKYNSTPLATNPSYIGIGLQNWHDTQLATAYVDDLNWAEPTAMIMGLPETDDDKFIILKDIINPAASGLWNSTSNTQANANYMSGTWSRGNASVDAGATQPNETIELRHVATGTVYATNYTGTGYHGTMTWNIKTLIIDSGAPMGMYALYSPRTHEYSNQILYKSNGANVTWNQAQYSKDDSATVIYFVLDGGYWDTSLYSYRVEVRDVWGAVKSTTPITASTGSVTHDWADDDEEGVYYAFLIAKANSGGYDYYLGYDDTELVDYFQIDGHVLNAENATAIQNANVSFTQGTTIVNLTGGFDGNYTSGPYFTTGSPVYINATATGFYQYLYNFTPLAAKTLNITIVLEPTSPTYTGVAIGGVDRDTVYGNPISGATIYLTNSTYNESYFHTTSSTGYYKFDETPYIHCFTAGSAGACEVTPTSDSLTAGRWYDVVAVKLGHSNSTTPNMVQAVGA